MLTRALATPSTRKSPRDGDGGSRSLSMDEYSVDFIVGIIEDLPLVFCTHNHVGGRGGGDNCRECRSSQPTLKEMLRSSTGVIGESRLGMTEKVVVWEGKIYAVKRFRKLAVRRREFGKRVERLAQISRRCEYLVPVIAYLYTKRIKFIVCEYFPMGSLADLLAGGRERGHTALGWNQRLMIILHIARAIAFIHSRSPSREKNMQVNVHGNIKASNIMIDAEFAAHLTDYGFTQLAERVEVSDTWQWKPPAEAVENIYSDDLSQKGDIYNFGIIMLDMLAGTDAPKLKHCILEHKENIKNGDIAFFEFSVKGKDRKQALQVLDIALACTNRSSEGRPSIEQIMLFLGDVFSNR